MKKLLVVFIIISLVNILYADNVSDLLDKAKESYLANDIDQTLSYIDDAKSEIKKSEVIKNSSEVEKVEFSRLKNFPSRYCSKKIILTDTAIGSTDIGKKFDDCYRITVSTINQSASFYDDPYDNGSLFFIISESLLEKLMNYVRAGYVGYFNVYTDPIYSYKVKELYTEEKVYYVAKITSLEILNYNSYEGSSYPTGDFLSE